MFQVDLSNWMEFEFLLIFKLGLTVEGIDNLPYWRTQYFMESFKEFLTEQQKYMDSINGDGTITKKLF